MSPEPNTPRIGIATSCLAPGLDEDAGLLRDALAGTGVIFETGIWDDPSVDWASYDHVLVRSTWDYPLKLDAFLTWIRVCRQTANPAKVLEWNTDKRYLDDLAAAGVPTVPTVFVPPGTRATAPWQDVVVKPAVSGSAADTGRFAHAGSDDAVALISTLHGDGRTAMVQPYHSGIDTQGETSMIYLGSEFSHAVRREPLLAGSGVRGPVVVADVLATVKQVTPTAAQLDVAGAALDAVPGGREQLSYARVDLIPGDDGPLLLELEATDCFLFLAFSTAGARERLVSFTQTTRSS